MPISLIHLLMEYSEKVYKTLIDRYKKQNFNLDEEIIRGYINRFAQLSTAIRQRFEQKDPTIVNVIPKELQEKNKYLDIMQWKKFTELEKVVDIFPASRGQQKAAISQNMAETDADEIYNKDNLEIYRGDSENRCIKYGQNQKYSWCISRAGSQNMYNSYRFQQGTSRMFYFVFDKTRPSSKNTRSGGFTDPYHAIVIHTFENGRYAVTNAENNGDKTANKWEEIGNIVPSDLWNKLKPLKNLFKYNVPSQEETDLAALKGKRLSLEQFVALSYNVKLQYIQANAKDGLTTEQFKTLDFDLKNAAINYGRRCSFDELKSNLGLLKRYPDYRFTRHEDEPLPYEFIPYLKEELQRLYYDKFEEQYLTFDEIEKYFSKNILNEYIAKQIEIFGFLPEEAVKHMKDDQKALYSIYNIPYMDVQYYGNPTEQDTIAPDRLAMVPELSYKTFNSLDSSRRNEFINLIKKIGGNSKNISYYNKEDSGGFFTGVPTMFEYNNNFYFIMPMDKAPSQNSKSTVDNSDKYLIVDENGQSLTKTPLQNIKLYKGDKMISDNPIVGRQTGGNTYWVQQREFDNIKADGKTIKMDVLKEAINESAQIKHKLQYLAGIVK